MDLSSLELRLDYHTRLQNTIRDFYQPCLRNSLQYDRAAGFFRSSVLELVSESISCFVENNGRIRLVCSPTITEKDHSSLLQGYSLREEVLTRSLSADIQCMLNQQDSSLRLSLLATLVAVGALDIRVAITSNAMGIYHEKLGIFKDIRGSSISFRGSPNETYLGWSDVGNVESFDVFCSWRSETEAERVDHHKAYFERLWKNAIEGVQVIPFPLAAKKHLLSHSVDTLEDILVEIQRCSKKSTTRVPLPHQLQAIEAWKKQGSKGILEHATGSGKTYTALIALKEHLKEGNPAIVLVPSVLLLEQWATEVALEIPDCTTLLVGGGNTKWRKGCRLLSFTDSNPILGKRIVIATIGTAATDEFRSKLRDGNHLMVVADEVHRTGSPACSRVLQIASGKRLGLSATPKRYGDPDGTAKILSYFGAIVQPPFSLRDAIECERLVPYYYYPHPVSLSDSEMEQWRSLSERISRHIAIQGMDSSEEFVFDDITSLLLYKRAHIAKKAGSKVNLCTEILIDEFSEGDRWLVYCDDKEQLNLVRECLKGELNTHVLEFHHDMDGDRAGTLNWFQRFGGVIVSIRCLDEGVDIPDASHAIILASSLNPREFIQRRGRVLRRPRDIVKPFATIHDAIVIPPLEGEESGIFRSLAYSELARCAAFAKDAINPSASYEISEILLNAGLCPESLLDKGQEQQEEEEDV